MALLGNIDDGYTSTGKGTLDVIANKLGYIPVIGGALAWPIGMLGTVIESARWLFRGSIGSAVTTLAAGGVANTVNAFVSGGSGLGGIAGGTIKWWFGNAASGILSGASLGTHARAATETLIGGATGLLGLKPQVLTSYPAAIGSIGAGMAATAPAPADKPGKFASNVSAERGQNADEAYARYVSGEGGAHVNELRSADGRGA